MALSSDKVSCPPRGMQSSAREERQLLHGMDENKSYARPCSLALNQVGFKASIASATHLIAHALSTIQKTGGKSTSPLHSLVQLAHGTH